MLPFHTCYSAYSLSRKTRGKVFIVLALSNQSLMMFFFFWVGVAGFDRV